MREKKLTEGDYQLYMRNVSNWIKNTEDRIQRLEDFKKMSKLSFEDWVKFQNGELKISDIDDDTK